MKTTARAKPEADFASAAMLRVLAHGMRELGLSLAPHTQRPAQQAATVSLQDKRQFVGAALAQGGIGCLALLGQGVHRCAHDPTHRALVSARDPRDLFTRWSRLERYIHSRHRIEVLTLEDHGAHIAHRALQGHPPPQPAENLVVLGVLVALLEAIGAAAVSARIGDVAVYPHPDPAGLTAAARRLGTAQWSIAWSTLSASPHRGHDRNAHGPDLPAPQAWPEHARHSFQLLCADLMNPLTLPALAQAQGEAPRSLQRQLSRAGLSYTQVLAHARCSAASWWLMRSAVPIAEVGFISGYADQAHFTRDFRGRVGMTPLRYRSDFGTPQG